MIKKLSKYVNTKTLENKIEKIDIILILLLFVIILITAVPSLLEFELNRNILRIEFSEQNYFPIVSIRDPAHPPFIYIIYGTYFSFMRSSNSALISLPTFIFWVLSIITFFIITSKMFGLIPAIISTHTFFLFSGDVHGYMFGIEDMYIFVLFALLSFYFLYKSFILKDEKYKWALLISNILMIWTYNASWFILIGQFSFLIIHRRKEFFSIKNLKYYTFLVIFSLPILFQFLIFLGKFTQNKSQQITKYEFFESIIINSHPITYNLTINEIFIPVILSIIVFLISIMYLFTKSDKYKIAIYYLLPFLLFIPLIIENRYFLRYNTAFMWIVFILISYPLCVLIHILKNKIRINNIDILFTLVIVLIIISNYSEFNLDTENLPYKLAIEDYKKLDSEILIIHNNKEQIYTFHLSNNLDDFNEIKYHCTIPTNIKEKLLKTEIGESNFLFQNICMNKPFTGISYSNNKILALSNFTNNQIIEITSTPIIYETLKNIKDFNESHYEFILHINDEEIKKVINNLLNCRHLNDYQLYHYEKIVSSYKCAVNHHGDY